MPIATFPIGPLETNCYVVYNAHDAVVVDPGGEHLQQYFALLKYRNWYVGVCKLLVTTVAQRDNGFHGWRQNRHGNTNSVRPS